LGRSKTIDQIGLIIIERFREARRRGAADEELLELANEALHAFQQSLAWATPDALDKLAFSHQHIGSIYAETGHFEQALPHYREALRAFEATGNVYQAAATRFGVALTLATAGRFDDALAYAQAARRNFETFGDRAAADIQNAQGLIAEIEQLMR
jgi:tetratricopeptide (TPR) repeat protein